MTKLSNPALLTTTQPVLALFVAVFGISVGLVCALLRVRSGLYDPTDLPIFFRLFVFEDYWPAVVALFVAPAALLRPVQAAATRLAAFVGTHSGAFVLLALLLMCIGCVGVYRSHPLSMDEYAPYFQSQVFAAGRLAGQFPPQLLDWLVPAGFQNTFLFVSHDTGKIVSSYWPGFALLLTPFTWLGAPWLLNPLLGAASIWLVVRFVAEFSSDEHVLGLAALLTFGSAAFLVNSISFYSMSAHALLNGVFAYLLLRPTASRCAWAGAAGSVALVLHNPLPHVLFAVPWIVWLALRNDRVRNVAALVAGYLPVAVILGLGWPLYGASIRDATGSVEAPLAATEGSVASGLLAAASAVFDWPTTTLLTVRAIGVAKLWIWAVPGLLLLAGAGAWRGWQDVRARLLALSGMTTLFGFLFVQYDQGHGWGFRYFHSAWLVLPVLGALAVRSGQPCSADAIRRDTPLAYAAALAALTILTVLPMHLGNVSRFMSTHLAQEPHTNRGPAKVMLLSTATGYYAVDLVQNDPFLREPVIRMISQGKVRNAEMMRREFPGLVQLSTGYRGEVWGASSPGHLAESAPR